jgi:putative transposase
LSAGPRGYDANKKVKGRKRVLMVDIQGDPPGMRVVSANMQDRDVACPHDVVRVEC